MTASSTADENDLTAVVLLRRLVWNSRTRRLRMPLRVVAGLALWFVIGVSVGRVFTVVFRGPSPFIRLGTSHMGNVAETGSQRIDEVRRWQTRCYRRCR